MIIEADETQCFFFIQDNSDGTSTVIQNIPGRPLRRVVLVGETMMNEPTREELEYFKARMIDIPDELEE